MRRLLCLLLSFFIHGHAIAETYSFAGASFPLLLETQNGQVKGLGADIAREILSAMGHQIEIQLYPWKRAQLMVRRGEADVLIATYKTPEREEFLDFTENHIYQDLMVFHRKLNRPIRWNGDYTTLKGKKIGVILGWSYGDEFDQIRDELKLQEVTSVNAVFQMLLLDRVDLTATNARHAWIAINRLEIKDQVECILPPIKRTNVYYGFSKKKNLKELRIQFDLELQKMIKSGRLTRLKKKYNL